MNTTQQRERRKCPVGFWVAVAIAVLAAIVAAMLALKVMGDNDMLPRDPNQMVGQTEGKSEEEIQAELDRIIDEGMFNIVISSNVEMADGQAEAPLFIENVPGNRYLMQVSIKRNDTGEEIYESGIIEPNHHVSHAKLDVDLDAGEYDCMATFSAFDPETEEKAGEAGAEMRIRVLS